MKMFIALKNHAARTGLSFAYSLGLAVALSVALSSPTAHAESMQAANPQPQADTLKPGLTVDYYYLKPENFQKKGTSTFGLAWLRPGASKGEK